MVEGGSGRARGRQSRAIGQASNLSSQVPRVLSMLSMDKTTSCPALWSPPAHVNTRRAAGPPRKGPHSAATLRELQVPWTDVNHQLQVAPHRATRDRPATVSSRGLSRVHVRPSSAQGWHGRVHNSRTISNPTMSLSADASLCSEVSGFLRAVGSNADDEQDASGPS